MPPPLHSRSGRGEEIHLLPLPRLEPRTIRPLRILLRSALLKAVSPVVLNRSRKSGCCHFSVIPICVLRLLNARNGASELLLLPSALLMHEQGRT